jgi:hypothetical protein
MRTKVQTKVQANTTPTFTPVLQKPRPLSDSYHHILRRRDHQEPNVQDPGLPGTPAFIDPGFGHDFSRVWIYNNDALPIQAKLRINEPGDVYEEEADRVADAVMRMEVPGVQRQVEDEEEEEETLQAKPLAEDITPLVQRQVELEEEEEELQAKATSGHISEVNPNLESHIQSIKGGGQPLSENDLAFFEPRFGHDFSQVRVHTDAKAAEAAQAVDARAFTVGKDVVFGAGQYAPGASGGRRLVAHELAHVVQQTGDKRHNSFGGHIYKHIQQDRQPENSVATNTKLLAGRHFSQSLLIQMKNGSELTSLSYYRWMSTDAGYWFQVFKSELEIAGYEFVTYVEQEEKLPSEYTPISQIRWLIKSPEGKTIWANAEHIMRKLRRLVELRAAKPKEGNQMEKREPIKFFSNPKYENVGVFKKWMLLSNTEEGIKRYKEDYGRDIVVNIYCSSWTRELTKVKLKTGQSIGIGWIIGKVDGFIIVEQTFGGKPAIIGWWPNEFAIQIKILAARRFGRILAKICTEQLFRPPWESRTK